MVEYKESQKVPTNSQNNSSAELSTIFVPALFRHLRAKIKAIQACSPVFDSESAKFGRIKSAPRPNPPMVSHGMPRKFPCARPVQRWGPAPTAQSACAGPCRASVYKLATNNCFYGTWPQCRVLEAKRPEKDKNQAKPLLNLGVTKGDTFVPDNCRVNHTTLSIEGMKYEYRFRY